MSLPEQTKQSPPERDSIEPTKSLDFLARMKRYQKNAEIIFDAQEPVGAATDLVMPRRRWFRFFRGDVAHDCVALRSSHFKQP